MKKIIVITMSILLLVLLVGVPEVQARRGRGRGRGNAVCRYEQGCEFNCPIPSCCRPYRHSRYIQSPQQYQRYHITPRYYFRSMPAHSTCRLPAASLLRKIRRYKRNSESICQRLKWHCSSSYPTRMYRRRVRGIRQ